MKKIKIALLIILLATIIVPSSSVMANTNSQSIVTTNASQDYNSANQELIKVMLILIEQLQKQLAILIEQQNLKVTPVSNQPSTVVGDISQNDRFISGNINSPVKVITYNDFESPFSGVFDQTIRKLSLEYGNSVAFIFRNYPLSFHTKANPAAEAAECVAILGGNDKFSSYVKNMFAVDPKDMNSSLYSTLAQQVGVRKTDFERCLNQNSHQQKIQNDMKRGQILSDNDNQFGIPYSVIYDSAGRKEVIKGAQPYDVVKSIIDKMRKY